MRLLSTVYVRDHRARVRHSKGSLIVDAPAGKQRIPLEAVDTLVILGNAQITSQALGACTQRGVTVAALHMGGSVRFTVSGAKSGNVNLRLAQFNAATDDRQSVAIAKSIVAAKVQNSAMVVDRWARDEKDVGHAEQLAERASQIKNRVARLADADSANLVRGIEGDVARIYFRALGQAVSNTGFEFTARTRRPPRDPVNALLGFCYSLLVTECTGAAESVGLDFQLGFLHRPRSGRPSLALDITEEFRALTDRFAVSLMRRKQIGADDFEHTPGGAVYLTNEGKKRLLQAWEAHKDKDIRHRLLGRPVGRWALPAVQATLLARHLRGDIPAYPSFILPW
ncbi:MAG: CRISPR-associated endonuclease Cas1 [Caldilineaceae bacterium]|nr:CRISPR-associated endonuclease Cas1 [Caldilineaceae bacterium]